MIEYGINLEVKINGQQVKDLPISSAYIRLSDSIHDPFPRGIYYFDDPQGMLKENGMMSEGLPISIGLGDDKGHHDIEVPLIVERVETLPNNIIGLLGGKLKLDLCHEYFKKQKAVIKSWKDSTVDTIANDLFGSGYQSFSKEATTGSGDFWCPGRLPQDYLSEVLLPYANSSSNADCPYVGFGNLKNEFVFQSLKKLMTQAPVVTLKYGPLSITSDDATSLDTTIVYDVKPFTNGMTNSRRLWNQKFAAFQEDDLTFDAVKDSTFKHLLGDGKIPIITKNDDPSVFYYNGNVRNQSEGQKKFLLARRNYRFLTTYFQEKLLITAPFQPMVWAGCVIELETYLPDTDKNQLQKGVYFSGKWLVEQSFHELDGGSKKVNTTLIVVRKTSTQAGKSSIKGDLISS